MTSNKVASELLKIANLLLAKDKYSLNVTYEVWDKEDMEAGDTDKRGFLERDKGFDSLYEMIDYMLDAGASEASSSSPNKRTWYFNEGTLDRRKGEFTKNSFHIDSDLSKDELKTVFNSIKKGRNLAKE